MSNNFSKISCLAVLLAATITMLAKTAFAEAPAEKTPLAENVVSSVADISSEIVYKDFESQIIDIFKTLIANKQPVNRNTPYPIFEGDMAKKLMKTYLAKMQNHEMRIKNMVYRTDNRNIRITFGDRDDKYLFKIAYSTHSDRVLANSRYADKADISDIKLIYYDKGKLNYIWIFHIKPQPVEATQTKEDEKKFIKAKAAEDQYVMHYNMAEERCGFCHELAKHDGSNTGLFFSRYQYKTKFSGSGIDKVDNIFRASSFVLSKKADTVIGKVLGDKMPDEFYYQRFPTLLPENKDQHPVYSIILEMPSLIEVLARDNNKNYCVSMQYEEKDILTNENYICADIEKKKLYVHYENPWDVNWGRPEGRTQKPQMIEYVRDFWDNPVMPSGASGPSKDSGAGKQGQY